MKKNPPSDEDPISPRSGDERPYRIDALARGIDVLKCLGSNPEPLSLKAICAITQYPKATVFRYLQTLTMAGLISHDARLNLYRIDVRMAEKFGINTVLEGLRTTCAPFMEALSAEVKALDAGTIVSLGVIEGADVLYLDVIGGPLPFRQQTYVGSRHPIHTTALGKAILAHMPKEERLATLPKVLRRRTKQSIVDKQVLVASLKRISETGYAEDNAENEESASCVGAPIYGAGDRVVAGISISAYAPDFPSTWKQRGVAALLHTTRQISRSLGHIPAPLG